MNKSLGSRIAGWGLTAAIGLTLLVASASRGVAGTLSMNITDGFTSYDIFDQIPPDVNLDPNAIQADTTGLVFSNFVLVGLNASSNNTGLPNPDGAVLAVGGHVKRTGGSGPVTLTITTYQTGFTDPTGAPRNMISTSSSSWSNVPAGSSQTFESWYLPSSPATPPPPFGIPAPFIVLPLAGTNSDNDTTTIGGLPGSASFSLTSQLVLTFDGPNPDITFGGQTQVLSVPEPASVLLVGAGIPLGFIGLFVRRRRAVCRQAS